MQSTVLEWFTSYLSCRFQQVLVGQSYSAETPLLYGVPQGSVIGPLLFSLYTKHFAELIQNHSIDYHLFADDSELYSCLPVERDSALQPIRNMESCCNEIGRWMNANKLKLNEHKTDVLVCGPPCRRESVPVDTLAVGDARIQFSSAVKLLKVRFESDLSLEKQVSSIVKACFFHLLTAKLLMLSIAVCLVLSKLDYCNSLLCGLPQTQIKRLQAV